MSRHVTERDARELPGFTRLKVSITDGPDRGKSFEAEGDAAVSVGAATDNGLVLTDPQASRYHLELTRTAGGVQAQDLGSLNGTWLGGARILLAIVAPGTRLRVGQNTLEVVDGAQVARTEPEPAPAIDGLVYRSHAMAMVARHLERLGSSRVSVLVQGETGTGKEVVARALHQIGPRREAPFVVVDCGSMPATLIASELFGHERGAFTGADKRRAGAFERANGGTVFLDEIGELPLAVQPALLGVLERRRFRRVGGDEPIDVDVRVIAATHRDLRRAVNDGTFRADLYYRLAVARLRLPALRERPEDIALLVQAFAMELTGDPEPPGFGPSTMAALERHPWTGNVRELRNVVESAVALGVVRLGHTDEQPPRAAASAAAAAPDLELAYRDARSRVIEQFERAYLGPLIERCEGNASKAAREAGMDRNYLVSLLRKHRLRD